MVGKEHLKVYPRKTYPHAKPIGLIPPSIGAVTRPGDLVIDPAAGSFVVLHAARQLGRDFIGCDIAYARTHQTLSGFNSRGNEVVELFSAEGMS